MDLYLKVQNSDSRFRETISRAKETSSAHQRRNRRAGGIGELLAEATLPL